MNLLPVVQLKWVLSFALLYAAHAAHVVAQTQTPQAAEGAYIVTFNEPGMLRYTGGANGLRPTAPEATGRPGIDASSPEAVAYARYLADRRSTYLTSIASVLGRPVKATHHYAVTQNGVALDLSQAEVDVVRGLPGVEAVLPSAIERTATYRGPEFIGAGAVWDGSVFTGAVASRGEGTTIGILDTGIDAAHPSFANESLCGYDAQNRKLKSAVDCSSTDTSGACNGAHPEDSDGHGTHVASIAAGNRLASATVPAPELPPGFDYMTGVAPCAALRSYKVCSTPERCTGTATLAAVQQAIIDRVDVVNYSISGGRSAADPQDVDYMFLPLIQANIAVVAAAGDMQLLSQRGGIEHRAPWVASTVASMHNTVRRPLGGINGPDVPPVLYPLELFPGDYSVVGRDLPEKMSIRRFAASPSLCDAATLPDNFFAGGVAYVRFDGGCDLLSKINKAKNAGAVMVLVSTPPDGHLKLRTKGAPATMAVFTLTAAAKTELDRYLDEHNDTAQMSYYPYYEYALQDSLVRTNLTGPTSGADKWGGFIKPDFVAPGDMVYAAIPGGYGYKTGTSMAAPHIAGSIALLRAVRRDWTAMELLSAIKMTAYEDVVNSSWSNYASIEEKGSGRIVINSAANSPLLMDETAARFTNASTPEDLRNLNLPSIMNRDCEAGCSFKRTVRNPGSTAVRWHASYISSLERQVRNTTVTPENFSIAAGGTQDITIRVEPIYGKQREEKEQGKIKLTPFDIDKAAVQMPLSVVGKSDGLFAANFGATSSYGLSSLETLLGQGWTTVNHSTPSSGVSKAWIQGDIRFQSPSLSATAAQSGHPNSYIRATPIDSLVENATNVVLSVWLISPEIEFGPASTVKFWTRAVIPGADSVAWTDSLEVRVCQTGKCGNVNSDNDTLANYSTLALAVNPDRQQGAYPSPWTPITVTAADGLPTSGRGRVAFRYYAQYQMGPIAGFVHAAGIALDTIELTGP
ncbi:MAG: S8 family serine peptidase [Rhodanobacteraceae bacterium]|nr:S8 family serine peptidase [Rhodanobacteraceae bacterium]